MSLRAVVKAAEGIPADIRRSLAEQSTANLERMALWVAIADGLLLAVVLILAMFALTIYMTRR